MCASYIEAAQIFGFQLSLACPDKYTPDNLDDSIAVFTNPQQAVSEANLVVTDVWTSMGDEQHNKERLQDFTGYQVTTDLLDCAQDPLFLHCLPAHRGEEVDNLVLTQQRSGVWKASENRLHVQKSLVEFLLNANG